MASMSFNSPVRVGSHLLRYLLINFAADFPDEPTCLEWLWRNRYSSDGTHAECPKCQRTRLFKRYSTSQRRRSWTCTGCGHHLHPTAGTIFHKSSTPLDLWFRATFLMKITDCRISAKELQRELRVTYKTAWRMAKLLRMLVTKEDDEPVAGAVGAEAFES